MEQGRLNYLPATRFSSLKMAMVVLAFIAFISTAFGQDKAGFNHTLPVDIASFAQQLSPAPLESSAAAKSNPLMLELPMPDGGTRLFRIVESPIMAPDFAALYPSFKTYAVQATDDPSVTGRISITPYGLNAVILSGEGLVLIRPLDLLNPVMHEVSLNRLSAEEIICDAIENYSNIKPGDNPESMNQSNGATKRTYSLAIVTTGEFHNANGGTVPAATAVVISTVNGIQAIFERELAVNFSLLTPHIYTNPATDPFNPGLNRTLEAAEAIELNFPGGGYDLGHVFHDQDQSPANLPGGGVAGLGVVCSNGPAGTGYNKGRGWSGSFNNTSSGWINLATHEFGHMFNMPHSFNGTGSNCTSNIDPSASYEIASGTTIMSYNGLCGAGQNIPSGGVADHYFHAHSLDRAVTFMNSVSCHTGTATGNTPPTVNANPCGGAFTIPKSTPFRLTGSGSDVDGDQIYYAWEQYDEDGAGTPTQGFIGATAAASTIAPLFRSYPPTTSPTRTFPRMDLVVANNYTSDFEPLPSVARTLNFRLTGRDWKVGGGGIHCSPLAVTVSNSGPFQVTAPNGGENLTAGNNTTVSWNVNGTNAFCSNVNIRLSIDGGLTYPYTLLSNTPNDGSQSVTIPQGVANSSTARMMVECAGNTCVVFFDISNNNFSVTSNCAAATSNICPTTAMTLPLADPGLNLMLTNHYGSEINQHTFTINNASPTGPLANATTQGGNVCQTAWQNERYSQLNFAVASTGSYTITNTSGGQIIFSIFSAAGYNPASPCSSTFFGSNAWGAISWGSSATVTLTACTTYKLVVWTLFGASATPTLTISGAGTVYSSNAGPGANYDYTYVAVSTATNLIAAVSSSANFTSLIVGNYQIYGASYYSGSGPNPPPVLPVTWIGQSMSQILSSGSCVLFSSNYKSLTVTGPACIPPVILPPTVTQPTCGTPTGTIVVNATSPGNTLQYSVNNGTNWQASPTFSGLAPGNYNIKVRLQTDPTCMSTYVLNPVVLDTPANCCPPTLAVNGNPIPSGTYEAQQTITSNGTVANGGNVIFKADDEVDLQANFEVMLGGVFEIIMDGCTP